MLIPSPRWQRPWDIVLWFGSSMSWHGEAQLDAARGDRHNVFDNDLCQNHIPAPGVMSCLSRYLPRSLPTFAILQFIFLILSLHLNETLTSALPQIQRYPLSVQAGATPPSRLELWHLGNTLEKWWFSLGLALIGEADVFWRDLQNTSCVHLGVHMH